MRRPEDPVARLLDVAREPERRLAAELGDDADRLLAVADGEHLLRRERLEVEPVGGVVVGGDGLRVAVDHDRLVAERAERLRRVDAAVVELDALADAVRAGADDHDARLVAGRQRLVRLAPGRVEVVRARLHLAGARVDAPERREDALRVPPAAHLGAVDAERRADRVVAPARALRAPAGRRRRAPPRACSICSRNQGCSPSGRLSVEARPRRGRAGLELARPVRLQERLA